MRGSALRITPRFRRPSAHYRVQFTLGHTTFTITGPDFVCSGFSRHMPVNFAFAIKARVKPLGEPAVDRSEKLASLIPFTFVARGNGITASSSGLASI
jgi:hypothetical protein